MIKRVKNFIKIISFDRTKTFFKNVDIMSEIVYHDTDKMPERRNKK